MAVLHAVEGPLRGQRFPIPAKPKLIVGRYEVYDLIVPDPSISRKHFAFEMRADGLYLIDLGSLNGTQLNGLRVSTAKLEQGDRITAGQTVVVYDEADGATAPISVDDVVDDEIEVLDDVDLEVEELADDDILQDGPISLGLPSSDRQTPRLGRPVAIKPGAHKSSRRQHGGDIGSRVTERLTTAKSPVRKSGRGESGKSEPCAACGRKIPAEEIAGGEGAKTRMGYVCGRCVEKRQRSGQKGSLEKFIKECQKRRK